MASLGNAARTYAGRGWPIIPLTPGGKTPLTHSGFKDASNKAHIVNGWWSRWPDANIGLPPRGAGFAVIDIDGPKGETLAQRLGLLAEPTLMVTSGRDDGGRHLYFLAPDEPLDNTRLSDHLEVRCDAGYVVIPPSVHPSGRVYRWLGKVDEVRPLPPSVLTVLRDLKGRRTADPVPETIGAGSRNRSLFRLGCAWRRLGASEGLILAGLEAANHAACKPPLDLDEVLVIAASAARYAPAEQQESKPQASALPGSWGTR